jgi:hypothetical protein
LHNSQNYAWARTDQSRGPSQRIPMYVACPGPSGCYGFEDRPAVNKLRKKWKLSQTTCTLRPIFKKTNKYAMQWLKCKTALS